MRAARRLGKGACHHQISDKHQVKPRVVELTIALRLDHADPPAGARRFARRDGSGTVMSLIQLYGPARAARRWSMVASVAFGLASLACSSVPEPSRQGGPAGQVRSAIVGGTSDTAHTAVASLLAVVDQQGDYSECSGTVVQVKNGDAYVLTAASCCVGGTPAPSLVVLASDYSSYVQYLGSPNPPPPAYAVLGNSVVYDASFDVNSPGSNDFCMLKFAGATASTPVIPLPQSGADGLTVGTPIEYVGLGVTSASNQSNSSRIAGDNTVAVLTAQSITTNDGSGKVGTCYGDQGGPVLLPPGTTQSEQAVVGVIAYGDAACDADTVSSRVESAIGPGLFITNYLDDMPSGLEALGNSCSSGGQCGSGTCVDGVCCDQPCAGSCDVCSQKLGAATDGTCSIAPAGYAGSPACAPPQGCTGAGASCAACTKDAECAPGKYCASDGTCQTPKAQGSACSVVGADCKTAPCGVCGTKGGCQDGFCCNTTCGNACDVCAASEGATTNGTCGAATAGSTTPACAAPYVCDGTLVTCASTSATGCASDADCAPTDYCAFTGKVATCLPQKAAGASCNLAAGGDCVTAACRVCASTFCATGVCCQTACDQPCAACTGAGGQCLAANKGSPGAPACTGYVCDGQNLGCPTTCNVGTDCASGYACVNGTCVGAEALATACTADAECASGHCADGVCCNDVCDGQCAWCADPSNPGTCEPTPAGQPPKGTRSACSGSGACAGQCDGATLAACVYAGNATQCAPATCVNDSILTASTCDTAGGCAAGALQDCGSFTCDPTAGACKTACTTKTDCRLGAVCDTTSGTGVCNAAGATCPDAYSVKASDGTTSSCNGYQCVAGACQQQCSTSADCAPSYDCTNSSCVATGTGAGGGPATGTGGATSTSTGGTSTTSSTGGATTSSGGTTSVGSGGASATSTGGTPTTSADAGAQPPTGTGGKAGDATSKDAGGCGCRVSNGTDSRGSYAAVFAALALIGLRRRERPRRRGVASIRSH